MTADESKTVTYGAGAAPDDGRTPDERARALAPMLEDPDPRIRKSAVVALGRLRCASATEMLCRALDDRVEGVRALACQALGREADPASIPALVAHAHDASAGVRAGVLWGIANVVAHGGISEAARAELFTPVVVMAFDPDDGVRADAAAVLGTLRDPRATDALVVLLEDACPRVRANACASLGLTDDATGLAALLGVLEGEGEVPLVYVSALDGTARRAERGSLAQGSVEAARAVAAACALAVREDAARDGAGVRQAGEDPAEAGANGDSDAPVTMADARATAVWALGLLADVAPDQRDCVGDVLAAALGRDVGWETRYAVEALARIHDEAARMALAAAAPTDSAAAALVAHVLDNWGAAPVE